MMDGMKTFPYLFRSLTVLFAVVVVASSTVRPARGEKKEPCANDISDCEATGCGPDEFDPKLNQQKNIPSANQEPILRTIAWMKDLPDPEHFVENGDREELKQLGEGQKITVVAWALTARPGGQETCNCELFEPKDTDNHIVLVDPALKRPRLTKDKKKTSERHSVTAEFTPRVRLEHPNFTRDNLNPLIDPKWKGGRENPKGKLLVRVTGLLMFDSHHFLHGSLTRENNWEIHPVLKMEYCPEEKTCRANSDANWKNLEDE